jgi:hypothetical protein
MQQPRVVLPGPGQGPDAGSSTPVSGVPLPPRSQQRVSLSGTNGHTTAGASINDAITIDDDDDDNTVAVPTPAIAPAPAPMIYSRTPVGTNTWAAAPPPPAGYPPPYSAIPTAAQPQSETADAHCAMCRKACGLDLRSCAERNGGRKGLKDRIRKLNADGNGGGDAITALYEVYQVVCLSSHV